MDKFIEKSKNIIQLICIKYSNIFEITSRNYLDTEFGGYKEHRFNILEKLSKDKYDINYIINKESFINNLNKIKIKYIKHNYEIFPQKFLKYSGCNINNSKEELIKKSNLKFNNNNFKNFIYNSSKDKSNLLYLQHNI